MDNKTIMPDEGYQKAYMEGYTAGLEYKMKQEGKPYIDKQGIIERYDGKIGINKAGEILRAVRRVCGGGKLESCSIVLVSELEYWESIVNKQLKERL
ncbi:MAG: hypothetical protein IJ303_02880 [Clostridia bacterium]|nr:hypothetical protein [Clostridia bacterium]